MYKARAARPNCNGTPPPATPSLLHHRTRDEALDVGQVARQAPAPCPQLPCGELSRVDALVCHYHTRSWHILSRKWWILDRGYELGQLYQAFGRQAVSKRG